jgi:NAD(P)-dependent dehydrogenase (short-subunit alcohol dehydrogenase family)
LDVSANSELANLASFLISDQAGYINGETVVQDGGASARFRCRGFAAMDRRAVGKAARCAVEN